jgi:RNA polymerase sigma factor (sigma-70 family)
MAEPTNTSDNPFALYVVRLREGDVSALEELVGKYAPVIRLEARMRLRSPYLRGILDSQDICQSVLKSFFTRVAEGQYSFDRPEDLKRLLVQMACNKSLEHVRHQYAQKRDARRSVSLGDEARMVQGADEDPGTQVEWEELLVRGRLMLNDEERKVADRRSQGASWDEIAGELGGTPDRLRVMLSRAQTRIARDLGLGVDDDE